jgi:hypothetical protein
MIHATCYTNLDEFKRFEWPIFFAVVPRVGDWVEGRDPHGNMRPKLRVASVTHREELADEHDADSYFRVDRPGTMYRPEIRIELHR